MRFKSISPRLLLSLLLPLIAAAPAFAAEFEVLDKLAVTGSAVLKSSVTVNGMAAPAVSPAGAATIYFDSTANKLRVSQNAGNYVNLVATGTANRLARFNGNTTPNFLDSLLSDDGANVSIGTVFQLSSAGDLVKIKNIGYAWPGSQGGADTYLRNDGAGALTWQAVTAGAGDNLGTHIATQTLNMAAFDLVNVSSVSYLPNVFMSSATAAQGGGVYVSSNAYIVGFSSAAKYYGDGSSLTGISGDNLGTHIATQTLNMAAFDIVGVSTLTVSSITTTAAGVTFSTNVFVMKGNVGIGTTSPLRLLTIKEATNSALATQLHLFNEGAGSHAAGIGFQVSANSEYTTFGPKAGIVFERNAPNGRGDLKFFNRSSNDTAAFTAGDERMRITGLGKVGIGTSSPASILNVNLDNTDYTNTGGAGSHFVMTNPNGAGQNVIASIINGVTVAKWRTDYVGNITWVAGGSGAHNFNTGGDYPTGDTRMSIANNGNVGIGAVPGSRLEVAGGSVTFHGSDSNPAIAGFTDAGGNYRMVISTSGNVGIGTAGPGQKLDVAGVAQLGSDQTDYIHVRGGGGTGRVEAVGGNTNVNLALSTKGTGSTYFWRGGYGGT
ncbi:MAG TPA: hypothetical protein DCZ93_03375, partial [Elusimicrobia bacterium]|nr:hypothetical protein [Elusimicrobiota bacterium]